MKEMEDEQLKRVADGKTDTKTALAVIAVVVGQVKKEVEDVKDSLDKGYATKADLAALSARIKMLERIVYGAVGVILLTVLGALLTLVLRNGA